jgi:hypothetical protein
VSAHDPGLFRPWRQDDRPIWQVTARWTTAATHTDDDVRLLAKTLDQTGMVQHTRLEASHDRLTAGLYLRASGQEAAELIAVRVVEVAHQAAGLGALGSNVSRRAVRHRPSSASDS